MTISSFRKQYFGLWEKIQTLLFLGLLGFATSRGETPLYPTDGSSSAVSDDGSSPSITLQQCFPYFGRRYCQLYVNQNGHLTFKSSWGEYTAQRIPMNGSQDFIALLWTDIDNRERGTITYNQYTSGDVLQQATRDIDQYFPQYQFEAVWVFVATWKDVAYYDKTADSSTFQVVVISDGSLSFVLMNYKSISHTSRNIQAGYDTIGSTHYFSILGSFTPSASGPQSSFCLRSNVNIPGRWAFRVDSETIKSKGTCIATNDPHYLTFDGTWHHFQGTCTYVLSEQCHSDLPYYRVEGSNEHRGSTTVSWTRLVKVIVYNITTEIVKGHRGEVKVNGVFRTIPFSLNNGTVHVRASGFFVVVSTDFGLEVYYDTIRHVKIQVPSSYQNATCGLCGNFNNDPDDDFRTPEGELVSAAVFGNSWKVEEADEAGCEDGCEGPDCIDCPEDQKEFLRGPDLCGILLDINGPFADCHSVEPPDAFVENCVIDLCHEGGPEYDVCPTLESYSRHCHDKGIQLQSWRSPDFCGINCSANSHFEPQGTACPATCVDPDSPHNCTLPPEESCICDEGFVLSGDSCVPLQDCGCNFEEYYYRSGETVVLGGDCGKACHCSSGTMTCHSNQCGPNEQCKVLNGKRGCYSGTCSLEGIHGPAMSHTEIQGVAACAYGVLDVTFWIVILTCSLVLFFTIFTLRKRVAFFGKKKIC